MPPLQTFPGPEGEHTVLWNRIAVVRIISEINKTPPLSALFLLLSVVTVILTFPASTSSIQLPDEQQLVAYYFTHFRVISTWNMMSGIIYLWSLQISRSTQLVKADGCPLPEVSAFYKEVSPRHCHVVTLCLFMWECWFSPLSKVQQRPALRVKCHEREEK